MSNIYEFPNRPRPSLGEDVKVGGLAGAGPLPVDPALRAAVERATQAALDTADRLIAILDTWDGDADLEPDADAEPSLGAPEGEGAQVVWLRGGDADLEVDEQPEGEPDAPASRLGRFLAEIRTAAAYRPGQGNVVASAFLVLCCLARLPL